MARKEEWTSVKKFIRLNTLLERDKARDSRPQVTGPEIVRGGGWASGMGQGPGNAQEPQGVQVKACVHCCQEPEDLEGRVGHSKEAGVEGTCNSMVWLHSFFPN